MQKSDWPALNVINRKCFLNVKSSPSAPDVIIFHGPADESLCSLEHSQHLVYLILGSISGSRFYFDGCFMLTNSGKNLSERKMVHRDTYTDDVL